MDRLLATALDGLDSGRCGCMGRRGAAASRCVIDRGEAPVDLDPDKPAAAAEEEEDTGE